MGSYLNVIQYFLQWNGYEFNNKFAFFSFPLFFSILFYSTFKILNNILNKSNKIYIIFKND